MRVEMTVAEMIKFYLDSDVNVLVQQMFYHLAKFGMIEESTFDNFSDICETWELSKDGNTIIDGLTSWTLAVLNDNGEWEVSL